MSRVLLSCLFDHTGDGGAGSDHGVDVRFRLNDKIDDDGSFRLHGLVYCGGHVCALCDTHAGQPVSSSQHCIVGAGDGRLRVVAGMEELLPLAYHAQVTVVHDGYFDGDAILLQGSQFLDVHLDAAITGNDPDGSPGQAHLDTHGSRQGETHRAQAAGGDVAIAARPEIVAGRPHLVLSNIGDDDSLATGFCADGVQDAGGVGILLVAFDVCNTLVILCLPGAQLAQPGAVVALLHGFSERRQASLRVGHDRYGGGFDLVHLCRININV